jgi:hypothetical protein
MKKRGREPVCFLLKIEGKKGINRKKDVQANPEF